VALLYKARKEIEITRKVPNELRGQILANKRAGELGPMFEEQGRKIVRHGGFSEEDGPLVFMMSVISAVRYFELCPDESRAIRGSKLSGKQFRIPMCLRIASVTRE
jgi:hypothetical protein